MLGIKSYLRASLVVQWLRLCLAMQGTRVQSLAGALRSYVLQLVEPVQHSWRVPLLQWKTPREAAKTQGSQFLYF